MKIIEKLSTYAALIGVIGAIGGGFYTWGQFNLRLDQIENKEFVVNETVDLTDIEVKLKELETTIIGLDNDVLDNLRNDIFMLFLIYEIFNFFSIKKFDQNWFLFIYRVYRFFL